MGIIWEEEKDSSRRVVQCVVDGIVEGYYYEDASDPGVFVVWAYNPRTEDYVNLGPYVSEEKAKKLLKGFCEI